MEESLGLLFYNGAFLIEFLSMWKTAIIMIVAAVVAVGGGERRRRREEEQASSALELPFSRHSRTVFNNFLIFFFNLSCSCRRVSSPIPITSNALISDAKRRVNWASGRVEATISRLSRLFLFSERGS